MDIQWYPGHMAKAAREISEAARIIDVIIIVGDARATRRSVSGGYLRRFAGKKTFCVFNKTDLADPEAVRAHRQAFDADGVFFVDCLSRSGIAHLRKELESVKTRFRFNRDVRAMAAGIPNVGKSMLLNVLAGRASLKTENRPAVTRSLKWLKAADGLFLLDTPGVLAPKFSDPDDGFVLACLGSVRPETLDMSGVSRGIISFLTERYPERLPSLFGDIAADWEGEEAVEAWFELIAARRGFLAKGGRCDEERTSRFIFDALRNGKLGPVSFDFEGGNLGGSKGKHTPEGSGASGGADEGAGG